MKRPSFLTALITALISILLVLGALSMSSATSTPPMGEFSYDLMITAYPDGQKFTYELTYDGASFGTVYFSVGEDFSIPVSLDDGEISETFEVYNPSYFGDVSITLNANGTQECTPVDPAGPFPRDDGSNVYTGRMTCSNP